MYGSVATSIAPTNIQFCKMCMFQCNFLKPVACTCAGMRETNPGAFQASWKPARDRFFTQHPQRLLFPAPKPNLDL